MKKIITLIALIGMNTSVFANDMPSKEECIPDLCNCSSYTYGGIGLGPVPVPALTLSLGKRKFIREDLALDMGVNVATLLRWNLARGYVNGLSYFKQKPGSQCYVGFGGSVGVPFGFDHISKSGPFVSLNTLFGKEFYNCHGEERRFFQVEILYPTYIISENYLLYQIPFITLKYGFAF